MDNDQFKDNALHASLCEALVTVSEHTIYDCSITLPMDTFESLSIYENDIINYHNRGMHHMYHINRLIKYYLIDMFDINLNVYTLTIEDIAINSHDISTVNVEFNIKTN